MSKVCVFAILHHQWFEQRYSSEIDYLFFGWTRDNTNKYVLLVGIAPNEWLWCRHLNGVQAFAWTEWLLDDDDDNDGNDELKWEKHTQFCPWARMENSILLSLFLTRPNMNRMYACLLAQKRINTHEPSCLVKARASAVMLESDCVWVYGKLRKLSEVSPYQFNTIHTTQLYKYRSFL